MIPKCKASSQDRSRAAHNCRSHLRKTMKTWRRRSRRLKMSPSNHELSAIYLILREMQVTIWWTWYRSKGQSKPSLDQKTSISNPFLSCSLRIFNTTTVEGDKETKTKGRCVLRLTQARRLWLRSLCQREVLEKQASRPHKSSLKTRSNHIQDRIKRRRWRKIRVSRMCQASVARRNIRGQWRWPPETPWKTRLAMLSNQLLRSQPRTSPNLMTIKAKKAISWGIIIIHRFGWQRMHLEGNHTFNYSPQNSAIGAFPKPRRRSIWARDQTFVTTNRVWRYHVDLWISKQIICRTEARVTTKYNNNMGS